jgi:hypothetical protein
VPCVGDDHHLPASYPDDFSIEDQASVLKTSQSASATFRVLTVVLGGIALLVGGIGIMNTGSWVDTRVNRANPAGSLGAVG